MGKENQESKEKPVQEKTENKGVKELVQSIRENAKKLDKREYEKLDKNQSLKLNLEQWQSQFVENANIKSISISNEKNTISLNLYNSFVMGVMGEIYKVNMTDVKRELSGVAEYMYFNRMLSKEVKNNTEAFLKRLY